MLYRPRDENGDILPVTKKTRLLTGKEAIAHLIKDRMKYYQSSWWEYPEEGHEIYNLLKEGITTNQSDRMAEHILSHIKETKGVSRIENVALSKKGRAFSLSCDVITTASERIYLNVEGKENGIFQTLYR